MLTKKGTVAWIGEERTDGTNASARFIFASQATVPPFPLAVGLTIQPGSLALAGNTLYWTQAGPKSAVLP